VCMCTLFRAVDFGELLSADVRTQHVHTTYDLIANIVHDGEPGAGKGTYRVHILHKVLHTVWWYTGRQAVCPTGP